jgi:hypothetical protein
MPGVALHRLVQLLCWERVLHCTVCAAAVFRKACCIAQCVYACLSAKGLLLFTVCAPRFVVGL